MIRYITVKREAQQTLTVEIDTAEYETDYTAEQIENMLPMLAVDRALEAWDDAWVTYAEAPYYDGEI